MEPRRLLEDPHDLAFAGAVAPPPGADRLAAEALGDRSEHRPHLTRQAGHHVDVLEAKAGRAAERVVERLGAIGKARPARRVVAEAPVGEARAQRACKGADLDTLDSERRRDGLAGDVVGRAAEPARHEYVVEVVLLGEERGDLLDLVPEGDESAYLDPELCELTGQPRAVRVLDIARDDLVSDRHDRRPATSHGHDCRLPLPRSRTLSRSRVGGTRPGSGLRRTLRLRFRWGVK